MFKHLKTDVIYKCRKDAIVMMGTSRYRRALKNREFEWNYKLKEGENVLLMKY